MATQQCSVRVAVSDVVAVTGELDAHTAHLVAEAVRSLPPGHRHLDATAVSFAGAAALSVLLRLARDCAASGETFTVAPSDQLRRLARLAGLETTLPLV